MIKMDKLDFNKKNLNKFGITMAAALLVIALFIFLRHKYYNYPIIIIAGLFFCLAFFAPALLKIPYLIWMKFALVLSWINTRLILFILFFLVFTPMAIILKIFRVDLLDKQINKTKKTYWRKKEDSKFNHLSYERQF